MKWSPLFSDIRILRALVVVALVVMVMIGIRTQIIESTHSYPELAEINQAWTFEEFNQFFVTLAKEKTAVYAYQVLKYADIPSHIDTHRLGHSIGYVHYEQKGLAGIYECTTDFRNACEHALIVQALITTGVQALTDVAKVCSQGPGGLSAYIHCFHGVGHGLLAYFNYDYKSAITQCREIYDIALTLNPDVQTIQLWQECVGGVTMELTQGEHDKEAWEREKKIYMPDSDILMPCDADFIPEEVRSICYAYIKPRFLEEAGATRGVASPEAYPKALSYCEKIPTDAVGSKNGCYAGFGAAFAYFANGDARTLEHMSDEAIHNVHAWCAFSPTRSGQETCMLSALDNIYWGGQSESPASISYCSLAPDAELQSACFESLVTSARYLTSVKSLEEFCTSIPNEYQSLCAVAIPRAYGS